MNSDQNTKLTPQGFIARLGSVLNTNLFKGSVSEITNIKSGGISREDVINAQKAW